MSAQMWTFYQGEKRPWRKRLGSEMTVNLLQPHESSDYLNYLYG